MRSSRRAHLGGRLLEGKTQSMLARRQLEHGDNLSQRTLRLRQTTQLRSFDGGAGEAADGEAEDLACSSEVEPEDRAPICDIL